MADSTAVDSERSNPVKRLRWATQRRPGTKGVQKRKSIFTRHAARQSIERKRNSAEAAQTGNSGGDGGGGGGGAASPGRTIYFNQPLPASALDDEGRPLQQFVRNKIRTAKYTPLSFVPKNLWFQFQNIANVYFLATIILTFFPIFGASNPGLSAVPLIFIVVVTAIKDAIEDWRRTLLDNQLNNAPVHRLVNWTNVNTSTESVGPWRRIKKATSHSIIWVWKQWKGRKSGKSYSERAMDTDGRRTSTLTARLDAADAGKPVEHANGDVELGRVSGHPGSVADSVSDADFYSASDKEGPSKDEPKDESGSSSQTRVADAPVGPRSYGSVLNPALDTPETARFKAECWKDVRVGDFVRLYNGEQIPADVVVLATSDPDGSCYVETKNLDGETNLKVRTALHSGVAVKRARDCERAQFVLESEPPHANLYAYSGVVRWKQNGRDMAEPVGINNMLLRGCTLRNTEWVVGIVAFTGEETKIMLNSGITPSKRARISKDLNWNVVYNFFLLFIMCLVAGVVGGVTWAGNRTSIRNFEFGSYGKSPGMNGFITFWAAIILFQNLVPISLYISLEIIRTVQAFFIYSDTFMYYEKLDYPCTPKSWNISDDIGQIEYIFSDKTGTLTQNVMEFKKCTINGVAYGEAYTEALAGMQKRQGINVEEEGARAREQIARDRVDMINRMRRMHDNPYARDEDLTFVSSEFVSHLAGDVGPVQQKACEEFMLALALCHTVITERTPGDPPRIEFKAQSPDEAALVATARDVGFTVLGRVDDSIIVNVLGEEREYTVLNTLEFNSARKRMSAIIRMPDGRIILYCKGADSVIFSRLRPGEQQEFRKVTAEHLEMFAREGLRTLCIAMRELNEDEYRKWNAEHDIAAAAVQDREDKLDAVSDLIERDLTLIGGTAIEDRLQDGVPDAIRLLARAGIKLWVLTGDKVETAINIGFSCNLLDNDMDLIVLKVADESLDKAEAELDKNLRLFNKTGSDEELKLAKHNHEPPPPTHALVIDGDTLKLVLDDRMKQKFLLLCKECRSVLCCRVSPSQKAAVVAMVKNGLDVMTLSIGDGANDVAMIQEAHVGVGIAGEEGRQAVMSADFAIGQFRFLTRLMLVHGRWAYRRMAETIANFFYKNMVWTLALFWYQIYTNMDCSYAFDYTYILLFNLAFTSLPVIFMGILDQDVDDTISLAVPQLYRRGIERKEWTETKFWLYMLDGLYQSVICFFFTYLLFRTGSFNSASGRTISDYKRMGVYIANPAVVVVNTYILMNTYRWDWFIVLITSISTLLIFFWTGVYTSFTEGFTFYSAGHQVYGQLSFWVTLLLTIILCLLPRFVAKSYQKIYKPYDVDIIREQVKMGKFDYLKNADPASLSLDTGCKPSSELSSKEFKKRDKTMEDDERPLYPPSVAPTATTHNARSQNGSDGTGYTGQRQSLDRAYPPVVNITAAPGEAAATVPRPSFDRLRSSMDRTRPSFEASPDFTSAAYLSRMESSQSVPRETSRRRDISEDLR